MGLTITSCPACTRVGPTTWLGRGMGMAGLKCDGVLPTPLLWKGVVIKGFGRGSKVRKLHNTPPWLGLGLGFGR